MLKRSTKELGDHLVLESPQLANVEFKFPVMRELIQHWCQSRRVFYPQKPPMEVVTVSTAARDSDVTVCAVGWHGILARNWKEQKERRRGKEKARERKARRKEERKTRERATAGKEREIGAHKQHDQRWMEPIRCYCDHCWKWGHKKAQCPQWQERRPMELGAMVSHAFTDCCF